MAKSTAPIQTATGSSIDIPLPSHPLVGKVLSRKRGEWAGAAYEVEAPDGTKRWMTRKDFEKAVARATPKDVNLRYPHVKVGDACEYDRDDGYISNGRVQEVTQHGFRVWDVYAKGLRQTSSISRIVRPEVLAALEAKLSGDPAAMKATAAELYWDEQDSVYGPDLAPVPPKPRPAATPSAAANEMITPVPPGAPGPRQSPSVDMSH